MAKAGCRISRRAAIAVAIAAPAIASTPASAEDLQFREWESQAEYWHARVETGDEWNEELKALVDQADHFDGLIRNTRSASPAAAATKVRSLLRDIRNSEPNFVPALEDVLSALRAG